MLTAGLALFTIGFLSDLSTLGLAFTDNNIIFEEPRMEEAEAKEVSLEMSQDYSSFLRVDFSKEVGIDTQLLLLVQFKAVWHVATQCGNNVNVVPFIMMLDGCERRLHL